MPTSSTAPDLFGYDYGDTPLRLQAPTWRGDPKRAARLGRLAARVQAQADEKSVPSFQNVTLTRRRAAMNDSRAQDAERLRTLAGVLARLSAGQADGRLPEALRGLEERGTVERLLGYARQEQPEVQLWVDRDDDLAPFARASAGEGRERLLLREDLITLHSQMPEHRASHAFTHPGNWAAIERLAAHARAQGEWPPSPYSRLDENLAWLRRWRAAGLGTPEAFMAAVKALRVMTSTPHDPEAERRARLAKLDRDLVGFSAPGYFPTPAALAREVVRRAALRPGLRVLEPSAGRGDLAAEILAAEPGVSLSVIEVQPRLREVLEAKGFTLVGDDFLAFSDPAGFDRIIANPPFERFADVAHVRHMHALLRPGGRLVSVMGASAFFRQDAVAADFRAWLDDLDASVVKNPAGSFLASQAGRSTGVETYTVVIDRAGE